MPQTWEVIIDEILDPKQACAALGLCAPGKMRPSLEAKEAYYGGKKKNVLAMAGKGGKGEVSEEEEEEVTPKCKICEEVNNLKSPH